MYKLKFKHLLTTPKRSLFQIGNKHCFNMQISKSELTKCISKLNTGDVLGQLVTEKFNCAYNK
jgi:hypothetical protein